MRHEHDGNIREGSRVCQKQRTSFNDIETTRTESGAPSIADLIQRVSIPDWYANRPARVHRSGHYRVHLLCGVWFLRLRASGDPPFATRTSCQCRKRSAEDVRTGDACADDTLHRPFVRLRHATAIVAAYGEHCPCDGDVRLPAC